MVNQYPLPVGDPAACEIGVPRRAHRSPFSRENGGTIRGTEVNAVMSLAAIRPATREFGIPEVLRDEDRIRKGPAEHPISGLGQERAIECCAERRLEVLDLRFERLTLLLGVRQELLVAFFLVPRLRKQGRAGFALTRLDGFLISEFARKAGEFSALRLGAAFLVGELFPAQPEISDHTVQLSLHGRELVERGEKSGQGIVLHERRERRLLISFGELTNERPKPPAVNGDGVLGFADLRTERPYLERRARNFRVRHPDIRIKPLDRLINDSDLALEGIRALFRLGDLRLVALGIRLQALYFVVLCINLAADVLVCRGALRHGKTRARNQQRKSATKNDKPRIRAAYHTPLS